MKARQLERILCGSALGYEVVRRSGSHRTLRAPGRPDVTFSFHDHQTVGPAIVRKVLTKEVGLSDEEAEALL